jgi:UDP-glucose 4-epimerase
MSRLKILVTGGAGFIGSNIVDKYIELGHEVHIIDNLTTGKIENINPKAIFYQFDIKDQNTSELILNQKYDVISHHAAQMDVRVSVNDPIFDANNNIIGSLNIYQAAKESGVKKIIFASSGGTVYGEQENFPASETDICNPCSPYGISKFTNEKYLFYYKKVYNLEYVALRYGNVYGPRQNPHGEAGVVAIFTDRMLNNKAATINGDGLITRDYVYIDDVVNANVVALEDSIYGIFNISTGIETTVNHIFRKIKELTKSTIEEYHGEAKAGEQLRSVCSPSKLSSISNWSPKVELDKGLETTIEYFKNKVAK